MKSLVIILLFFSTTVFSQEYVELHSESDVKISYKWRKERFLKKKSPYVMYIKISNSGFEQKLVKFDLCYFKNLVPYSNSGEVEYCIKPGRTLKGKKWNLVFQSEIKTLKEIHDRSFSWELNSVDITTVENCKSGLRFKVEPAHQMNPSGNVSLLVK